MSPRFADVDSWLHWQETLHPNLIDLGLERVGAVAQRLLNPALKKPLTITVGGTNGKGSCVTALSVLLQALGRSVGSFTSPHIHRYNERIRINNKDVSDADLCAAFAAIDAARGDISITYFEFNALAALWLFERAQIDVRVLEVGLGGRLDAVNIVDADIAVITNIALDHIAWLGDTREKISFEKAGILRAHGKLVYGEIDMPASIRTQLLALECECRKMGSELFVSQKDGRLVWQGKDKNGADLYLNMLQPALPAPSVAAALQVLAWLGLWDEALFAKTIPMIFLEGRFERVQYGAHHYLFDVAHNVAGAQFVAGHLQEQKEAVPCVAVFSAMADKDLVEIVRSLKAIVRVWCIAPLTGNPRAATLAQLSEALVLAGVDSEHVQACADINSAVRKAQGCVKNSEVILVCGSFFTVGAVKKALFGDTN